MAKCLRKNCYESFLRDFESYCSGQADHVRRSELVGDHALDAHKAHWWNVGDFHSCSGA